MKNEQINWFNFRENIVVLVSRLTLQYSGQAFSGLLIDGVTKKAPLPRICYTSCNDETWLSYTLPKKDLDNI